MSQSLPRTRLLAILASIALGLAACGADETIDAAAGAPGDEPPVTEQPDERPQTADGPLSPIDGFTPLVPRTDLVSLQVVSPDEVVASSDGRQLLVRFQGAAEPCSGATVTVTETDTEVTVVLETGLDPNAAAMSCIAQVFDYEIVVPLDAPLGERTITA